MTQLTQAQIEAAELAKWIKQLKWKSVDKDNMEFEVRTTCYLKDALDKWAALIAMTQPTQAQIEAAAKALQDKFEVDTPPLPKANWQSWAPMAEVAITAAAQVAEEDSDEVHRRLLVPRVYEINDAIERCAQVIDEIVVSFRKVYDSPSVSHAMREMGRIRGEALEEAAAAIRKLKDAP